MMFCLAYEESFSVFSVASIVALCAVLNPHAVM